MCKYLSASLDILPLCKTNGASTVLGEFSLSCFLPLSSLAVCRAEALTSHFTGWPVFPGGEFGLGADKKCSVPPGLADWSDKCLQYPEIHPFIREARSRACPCEHVPRQNHRTASRRASITVFTDLIARWGRVETSEIPSPAVSSEKYLFRCNTVLCHLVDHTVS